MSTTQSISVKLLRALALHELNRVKREHDRLHTKQASTDKSVHEAMAGPRARSKVVLAAAEEANELAEAIPGMLQSIQDLLAQATGQRKSCGHLHSRFRVTLHA